jgi:mono/diheme cytochrome c family protein
MKQIFGSFFIVTAILLAAGLTNAQDKTIKMVPVRPTNSVDGRSLFHEYCAVCHGDDGTGNGPAARALKQSPGDLTRIAHNNKGKFPDELVLGMIQGSEPVTAHGTQEMPVWGTAFSSVGSLSVTQLRVHSLLQYIEGMQVK